MLIIRMSVDVMIVAAVVALIIATAMLKVSNYVLVDFHLLVFILTFTLTTILTLVLNFMPTL